MAHEAEASQALHVNVVCQGNLLKLSRTSSDHRRLRKNTTTITTKIMLQTRYVRDLELPHRSSTWHAQTWPVKLNIHNYRAWVVLQPRRGNKCCDAFWSTPTVTTAMKKSILHYRYKQLYSKKLAFTQKQAYMVRALQGQSLSLQTRGLRKTPSKRLLT